MSPLIGDGFRPILTRIFGLPTPPPPVRHPSRSRNRQRWKRGGRFSLDSCAAAEPYAAKFAGRAELAMPDVLGGNRANQFRVNQAKDAEQAAREAVGNRPLTCLGYNDDARVYRTLLGNPAARRSATTWGRFKSSPECSRPWKPRRMPPRPNRPNCARRYEAARRAMAKAVVMFAAAYADSLENCPSALVPSLRNIRTDGLRSFYGHVKNVKKIEDLL